MVKGNTTNEERAALEALINEMHVSGVNTIGVLGARTDEGRLGLLIFNSCCGNSAYSFTPEQLKDLFEAIGGCLAAMEEQVH